MKDWYFPGKEQYLKRPVYGVVYSNTVYRSFYVKVLSKRVQTESARIEKSQENSSIYQPIIKKIRYTSFFRVSLLMRPTTRRPSHSPIATGIRQNDA